MRCMIVNPPGVRNKTTYTPKFVGKIAERAGTSTFLQITLGGQNVSRNQLPK